MARIKKTTKKKAKKPEPVNPEEVRKLAQLGCTPTEIADFCGCHRTTISRRFARIITKEGSRRKAKLRELQWKAAENGSNAMLIWLGKQYLGQKETIENINREGPAADPKKVRATIKRIQRNGNSK